jgi:hypothetical protein
LTVFNQMLRFDYGNRNKRTAPENQACGHSPLRGGVRPHLCGCEEEKGEPLVCSRIVDPCCDRRIEGSEAFNSEFVNRLPVFAFYSYLECRRFRSGQSTKVQQRSKRHRKEAATHSTSINCRRQNSIGFNKRWNLVRDQGVGGSNPLSPTNLFKHLSCTSGFPSTLMVSKL